MGFGAKKLQSSQATRLEKPPKGHFFFAGRVFPRIKWWQKPHLRRLYFYCVILIFVNVANGFDGSMMNSLQSLPYWQEYFGHPKGRVLGMLGSSMSLGSIIGLPFVPVVCDRFGRKKGVILGSVILIIGVAVQAGASNYNMFLSARFVLGFGMSFATNAGPLLCAEIAHPQDRAIITTFMGCSYAMGSFVAAWTTFGTLKIKSDWAWRLPSVLQAWATVIVLLVIWWIPESPRYHMNRDNHHKALQMLAHYHGEGNEHDEFVQLEYTEIRTALDLDKEVQRNTQWGDLIRTKGNRHRMSLIVAIALFGQWSGNGIIAYYLKLVLDEIGIKTPSQQLGINGGSKAMSLLVNLFAAFYIDRLGRRPILMISTVGMLTCFVLWTILSARYAIEDNPSTGLGRGVVALIYMYNFSYNLKTGLPLTYTTEIMPYGLRAKAAMVGGLVTMGAVFFNQFINPIAMGALHWKYYIFYCCFLGFEVWFLYFFVVETRYVPMEEIAKYFDGETNDVSAATNAQLKSEMAEQGTVEQIEDKRSAPEVSIARK